MEENVRASLAIIEQEGLYPDVMSFPQLDNYTDRTIISTALKEDGKSAVQAAMSPLGRTHYWYGYLVVMRPLLRLMNYAGIRYLNMFAVMLLLFISAWMIGKKCGSLTACLYVAALCFGHIVTVPFSMQYSSMVNLMMLAVISVCIAAGREKGRLMQALNSGNQFLVIGALTAFYDFLTAPLLTLGIPLIALILIGCQKRQTSFTENTIIVLKQSVCWLAGYCVAWFAKWPIGSAILGEDIFSYGFAKIAERTIGVGGTENHGEISAGAAIGENIAWIFNPTATRVVFAAIGILIALRIFSNILAKGNIRRDAWRLFPILIVGAFPYLWYMVAADHSQVHFWMTYRVQIITVFAVFSFLGYGIEIHGIQRAGRRRLPVLFGKPPRRAGGPFVVNLTSGASRLYGIHCSLRRLLAQAAKPNKVILWLGRSEFPNGLRDLPKAVSGLRRRGLCIEWMDMPGVHAMAAACQGRFPDAINIYAQDHALYPKTWTAALSAHFDARNVVCHLTHGDEGPDGESVYGVIAPPRTPAGAVVRAIKAFELTPKDFPFWWAGMVYLGSENTTIARASRDGAAETALSFGKDAKWPAARKPQAAGKRPAQMQDAPKSTVIIPVYNAEAYLRQCLDSAIGQTVKEIEIICVNDHSTDRSLEILREYEKKDKRIIVLDPAIEGQLGPGGARNAALDIATGEYVAFLDADDYLAPDSIEFQYAICRENNLDGLRVGATACYETDDLKKLHPGYADWYQFGIETPEPACGGDIAFALHNKGRFVGSTYTLFFRRCLAEANGLRFFEKYPHEDELFLTEFHLAAARMMVSNESHYFRRIRAGSMMTESKKVTSVLGYRNVAAAMFSLLQAADLPKGAAMAAAMQARFTLQGSLRILSQVVAASHDELWNWLAVPQSEGNAAVITPFRLDDFLINWQAAHGGGGLACPEGLGDFIKRVPASKGSAFYDGQKPKAGVIADDFLYNTYAGALDIVYLTPEDYERQIAEGHFLFVLYVSCWRGMRGQEIGDADYTPHRDGIAKAADAVAYARARGIKTVFYTIEDPPDYDRFLPVAKAAEYVFTSAIEMVDDYKRDTGNDKVWAYTPGINPLLHNPLGMLMRYEGAENRRKRVGFAGTWYNTFPKRAVSQAMLYDGVIQDSEAELYIFDRHFFKDEDWCRHPGKYDKYRYPPLAYTQLQKASKYFDFMLNLNSVTESRTMCAMRTYELPALGIVQLSNYTQAIADAFPGTFMPHSAEEAGGVVDGISQQDLISRQIEGVRSVYSAHTVYDRLNGMFEKCGIGFRYPDKTVTVFVDQATREFREAMEMQRYPAIRLCETSDAAAMGEIENGFFVFLDAAPATEHYIEDLANTFKYCDPCFVRYGSWDDMEGCYRYIYETPSLYGTLFNPRSVPAMDVFAKRISKRIEGVAILPPQNGRA
ncbi:MAG: glycosyltransferase [Clostridiales Family XIII bacterium]|nr:glycosyltransferase [Clostridiales Family XIII bacterium]